MQRMAISAAKAAIDHAGIEASRISSIQVGVNTHLRFPSLAASVQRELDIKDASASDISAGCSAFIFVVENVYNQILANLLVTGEETYGLVIGIDALSRVVDWTNRSTCVLFGDGAGAAVIGPVKSGEILSIYTRSQGEYADLLYLDRFLSLAIEDPATMKMKSRNGTAYPFIHMEGRKVFSVAVRSMMADIRSVVAKHNKTADKKVTLDDIDFVIPHQANLRIVSAVQEGLKLRKDQVYRDGIINFGNTSAASIPIGYVDEWKKRPGGLEIDVAFGSGFASGAILRRMKD